MTPKQLVGLGLRLAGIVLALILVRNTVVLAGQWASGPVTSWHVAQLIGLLLMLMASFVLIAFPLTIAGRLLPGPTDETLTFAWSFDELQAALIPLMGLWMLVQAAIDASAWFVYYVGLGIYYGPRGNPSQAFGPEQIRDFAAIAAQAAAALYLLLRTGGVLRFLKWVRGV